MKNRVKLYKAGKLWVTALVAAMGIAVTTTGAFADQVSTTTTDTQDIQVQAAQPQVTTDTTVTLAKASTDANATTDQNSVPENINGYTKQQDQSGKAVWKNNSGQALNGWQNANNNWYQFKDGSAQTGWQKVGNDWYYMNSQNSAMETGIQRINNNTYYLNDRQNSGVYGAMQTGWQNVNNSWYYFENNGAAHTGWLKSQAGSWYYFDNNGQAKTGWYNVADHWYYGDKKNAWALTGWQYFDNNWFYFDPVNAWQYKGWTKVAGQWYYLDNNGHLLTGIQNVNGKFYYLNSSHDGSFGAMKTGWQFVNGHWYGLQGNGAAYTGWQNLNGSEYYFDPANAQMATGDTVINGSHYYFDTTSGHQVKGMILDTNGLLKYYNENTGVRESQLNADGKTYTFNSTTGDINTDNLVDGLNTIANHVYYFNKAAQRFLANAWKQINNKWYHFGNNGAASIGWFESTPAANWYFFNNDGSAKTGWYKSANGFWYYFDNQNAWALKNWQNLNGHWYHFDSTNAWANTGWYKSAAGNWYYFDPVNAWAKTGWFKSAVGNWYYFDAQNAWAITGWHKINGSWYYFDPTNAWADRGYQRINGVDYYFDPTNANMYQNRWVNVYGWTYHADNSGHLWFPRWYSQFTPAFYGEGCSVFSLAMLLSPKEYINTNYALQLLSRRQSGNLVNGAGFSIIIQPNSLVELAHHFDPTVRNISGSSVSDIINWVNAGHPVQYYGYSSYERSYAHRNHNKVIVGYRNGYFRIYDPCYWSTADGWYSRGGNAYDYGAMAWVPVSQFSREYAGQAITVD
ncbi:KxYKxGKxW signal peptide domain-containing protein [Limosilactobacillus kribbianus]|uniref:KxYKxGKxW signal peptide domain-containing protein n=1 Tax=Limosilactobacillus kribbianus TaxID=2982695 RepID=UPI0022652283|nr:KxYKxGKxW signal peptide domain-containing protein [Limosilactobacillus kribbianus]